MDRFLSTDDIVRMCHFTETTILEWITKGKLPASRNAEGEYQITEYDLVRFLQRAHLMVPEELIRDEQLKVLIIDDEAGMRRMLRANLLSVLPGVLIEESGEGFHGGWRAHAFIPNLILLDLILPGMDGFQLCQFIRGKHEFKDTKILVITGLRDHEALSKIMDYGADGYLIKPFTIAELKNKIHEFFPTNEITEKSA